MRLTLFTASGMLFSATSPRPSIYQTHYSPFFFLQIFNNYPIVECR